MRPAAAAVAAGAFVAGAALPALVVAASGAGSGLTIVSAIVGLALVASALAAVVTLRERHAAEDRHATTTRRLAAVEHQGRRGADITKRRARQLRGSLHEEVTASEARLQRRVTDVERRVIALQQVVDPVHNLPPHRPLDAASAGLERAEALVFDGEDGPAVVLVLQSFSAEGIFAGIRTAVTAAGALAAAVDRPLRLVVLEPTPSPRDACRQAVTAVLAESGITLPPPRVSIDGARDDAGHHADDVWVATYWTTAYLLGELAREGQVDPARVVYLVQDWEPSFYPWGDLHAKALGTYGLGFHLTVNSSSLAQYVEEVGGVDIDPALVFAPEVDTATLADVTPRWTPAPAGQVRLLFYARPSKPRNMFTLGLQAIREWAEQLPAHIEPVVLLAGEEIGEVELGGRASIRVLGKTSYEEYYRTLAGTDLGLALMNSPHPGHLALELPLVGIPTLTNEFGHYRTAWVDGLHLAEPHPRALGAALVRLTEDLLAAPPERHVSGALVTNLGRPLADVVADLAARVAEVPAGR